MNKGIRIAVNCLLVLCVIGLGYITVRSITDEIDGQEKQAKVEKEVQRRLKQIAVIEEEYKKQDPNAEFAPSFDALIHFCLEGRIASINAEGELTADQMDGKVGGLELTDSLAAVIVNRGNEAEIAKYGLEGFRRDTVWTPVMEYLLALDNFDETFDPEQLRYIPCSDGEEFDLEMYNDVTRSGSPICTMECRAPVDAYLTENSIGAYNIKARQNVKAVAEERGIFAGLKIGGIGNDNWNNNAGNWE